MNFSFEKKLVITPKKEKGFSTFMTALITATMIFLPFMIINKGYFVFYGDFNAQQIPFYQMCHKAVKEGNFAWNNLTDLGANFIGSYSYYLLGSIFFWITIPFPNSFVPYLMGPLLILKFACAAFTAYLYIRRFTRTPDAAKIGGLLYAFSGFSVYNIFFNSFHEPIICFPLLLLALEMMITENKRGVFALTVCLCAAVNYFFFFGMVIFTVIYFFVRVLSGAVRLRIAVFFALMLEAILGLLMSAVLLIPSLYAIIGNTRLTEMLLGWSAITYGKEQIYLNIIQCFFFPPDIPARPVFFPGAQVKWSSLGGWLPLFSMTGVFTLFICKKNHWLRKIIGICIFMAMIPILNSAFYAFNASYYARWFYMPILMMCLASSALIEDSRVDFSPGVKRTALVTAFFALVIGFFPQKGDNGKIIFGLYTVSKDLTYKFRFWVAVTIAVLSLAVFVALLSVRKKNMKLFFKSSIAAICLISIVYSLVFIASGRSHSFDIKNTMIKDLIEGEVYLDDDTEFRIDTYDCVDNTGMYLGIPSINAFHSIVPSSISEFYEYLGVDRAVASRPETDLPAIRPLLSVKYLLSRIDGDSFTDKYDKTGMPGYDYYKASGGFNVYKNENYIPFGFSYDYYFTDSDIKLESGDLKSRMMLKAVLLDEDTAKKYKGVLKHINSSFGLSASGKSFKSSKFNDSAMAKDCAKLAKTSADSFSYSNSGFSATVQRKKASFVFFSVPFDTGWSATVNGKTVEIVKANKGFMAVVVPEGESVITFTYNTPGLKTGAMISIIAFTIFLLYFIIATLVLKKYPKDIDYPEGKELISDWHKADIIESYNDIAEDDDNSLLSDLNKHINEYSNEANDQTDSSFDIKTDLFDD